MKKEAEMRIKISFHENDLQNLLCELFFPCFRSKLKSIESICRGLIFVEIRQDSESPERIRNFLQNVSFGVASNWAVEAVKLNGSNDGESLM